MTGEQLARMITETNLDDWESTAHFEVIHNYPGDCQEYVVALVKEVRALRQQLATQKLSALVQGQAAPLSSLNRSAWEAVVGHLSRELDAARLKVRRHKEMREALASKLWELAAILTPEEQPTKK